jgi:hypothetical protein
MKTTEQIISAKILIKVAEGMTIDQALDEVCGAGTFAKLASDLYHQLRAKQGL